ncbi:ribonuclease Z [Aquibacillus kalidii]|uniref:ribonuclease Z n=1 Tax=Aquibacillus kalidii TaxID=2762597 RepID=UPI0016479F0E|nr:ribonuclease Z [Aquibacillus kalidii]
MRLIFLGTGAGVPSKERNVSSIALEMQQENGSVWLFDCGEATQHQILRTNIRPRKIDKIFITHLHGDHIYGLPGFLSSRSFQNGESALTIYGPKGIREFVETSLQISGTRLAYPLNFVEVSDGITYEDEQFVVSCAKLDHGIISYGYRIVEKDLPGQLQPNKLKDIGVHPGPIYKQIKEMDQVQLENGEILYRKDFIGPEKPGRIVTILGDTRYVPTLDEFVRDSDVLVHESTFEQSQEELAYNYFHSTTKQAALLAKDGQVKKLILTHISSRYQDDSNDHLRQEAQETFENTSIAHDFFEIEIQAKN